MLKSEFLYRICRTKLSGGVVLLRDNTLPKFEAVMYCDEQNKTNRTLPLILCAFFNFLCFSLTYKLHFLESVMVVGRISCADTLCVDS